MSRRARVFLWVLAVVAVLWIIKAALHPDLYWSSRWGWYGSVRLPGGWRIGHRL